VNWLCSYLFDDEPVELSGIYDRPSDRVKQAWTLPYVPGRRYGAARPLWVLTSGMTFSGGEALSYDLQQAGRATVVGERTGGGAHPRRGFRVNEHLEATIPVGRAVSPVTGSNWEGTGVAPDIAVPAGDAPATAYRLALEHVVTLEAPGHRREVHEEAREALDQPDIPL
jgi:C-terminal processing protease CtpA/Prc